jgi:hypothetical protein
MGNIAGHKMSWKILLQKLRREHKDCVGIFLEQTEFPIRCFFSLAVLDDMGGYVEKRACYKYFQGLTDLGTSTSGWLFPHSTTSPSALSYERHEVRIQVDLTIFPDELDAIKPLFELIESPDTPSDVQRYSITSLGDFVTHFSTNPSKAKRYIQELDGAPQFLIALLEDSSASAQLQCTAAGSLWNILDTSRIYISDELVLRLINAACTLLQSVLTANKRIPPIAKAVGESEDENQYEVQLREHLVNSLTGLMWNIPVTDKFRQMIASNCGFFPSVFTVLDNPTYSRTHFTCLHLISTLHNYGHVPSSVVGLYRCHLNEFIESKEKSDDVAPTDVGVLLSVRDVADFFIPLLLSSEDECIRFGAWCINLFYFRSSNAAP